MVLDVVLDVANDVANDVAIEFGGGSEAMAFDARCFWYAKDLASAADYEDAFDVDPSVGRAAIADGVSTAIFSRRWAQLLTGSSVAAPPAWDDDSAVNAWILEQRKAWAKSINIHALPWMQKAKLEQAGGAYAAFLWAEVVPLGHPVEGSLPGSATAAPMPTIASGGAGGFRCRSVAVGDCCLFHVRAGEVLGRFPLSSEADFARDPLTFCSSSRNRQPQPPLSRCEFDCLAGDWIVLSSDALAKWLYRLSDIGQPIDWAGLWQQDAYTWTQRVGSLRLLDSLERIRVDDTTLVILRVGHSPNSTVVEASESATPTATVIEPSPCFVNPAVQPPTAEDDIIVAELAEPEDSVAPSNHDDQEPPQPESEASAVESTASEHAVLESGNHDRPENGRASGDSPGSELSTGGATSSASQGCASQGHASEGGASQGSASEGSASEGSASQGSASQGSAGEGSEGEGSASHNGVLDNNAMAGAAMEDRESSSGAAERQAVNAEAMHGGTLDAGVVNPGAVDESMLAGDVARVSTSTDVSSESTAAIVDHSPQSHATLPEASHIDGAAGAAGTASSAGEASSSPPGTSPSDTV